MFDFDTFINKVCIGDGLKEGIFGRLATYTPSNTEIPSFQIMVDFDKAYKKVELEVGNVPVTSSEIVAFLRLKDLPEEYKEVLQGDFLTVEKEVFQIIDVRDDISGVKKVVLHYASKVSY